MPDSSKDLLQRVFQAMPEEERVDFLEEVLSSLPTVTRLRILNDFAPVVLEPRRQPTSARRAEPALNVAPPTPWEVPAEDASANPEASPLPAPAPNPYRAHLPKAKVEMSEEDRAKLIEEEFKKIAFANPERPTSYWGQLFKLGAWALLALIAFLLLGVGGKELFDLIKAAVFPAT